MAFGFLKKTAEKVGVGVVKVGEAAASAAKASSVPQSAQ